MDPHADTLATLTPPAPRAQGADEDDSDYQIARRIATSAGKAVPLLGIGTQVAKYIANKVAAKTSTYKTLAHERTASLTDLVQKLDDASQKQWRDWLPETLRAYCGIAEDDVQSADKLMALQVAVTNRDVFDDWQLFLSCCTAFNHRRVNFEWLDKPSYLECAWACTVLRSLRPNTEFGPSVIRFILAVMLEDGLVFFPWSGGDGIALDDGETGKYVRGLTDCQDLARDMRKVWAAGVMKNTDAAELPDVDEKDPHHVQLAKLMNGVAYIRANEGKS